MQRRLSKMLSTSLVSGMLALAVAVPAMAQTKQLEGSVAQPMSMPKVGEEAPDFTLKYFDGKELKDVSLSQYRGKKNVVVAFFIFAFTGG